MNMDAIKDLMKHLSPKDLAEIDALLMHDAPFWVPLPGGPQQMAYESKADITGYGGAAGGGKTDLACGLSLTNHKRSIIFRREATQLEGIEERFKEIIGNDNAYNGSKRIWKLGGRYIKLGGVKDLGSEKRYQGQPYDLRVFDEVTEFQESQVRFLMGWLRSADPDQRCRVLMTFNPPTTAEGRWVISYFAPWLDDKHPNPALPGELRYFTTDPETRQDMECDGPEPIEIQGEMVTPMSRTFIPASVEDNPYYMDSGYKTILQALPEPLRSQMLQGDFKAGITDDIWQIIPTEWVELAMVRWVELKKKADFDLGEMDSMGVDVARGGDDETIISRRYGRFFDTLVCHPGTETPDGPAVAALVVKERRDQAVVHIDIIGVGASPYDFLKKNGVQTIGVDNRETSFGVSREGGLKFYNLRAEKLWRMREGLDPINGDNLCLPPDPKLLGDLCATKWEHCKGGIKAELKDEVKKRIGRSPDRGDAVVDANIDTMKTATLEKLSGGNKHFCGGKKTGTEYWE